MALSTCLSVISFCLPLLYNSTHFGLVLFWNMTRKRNIWVWETFTNRVRKAQMLWKDMNNKSWDFVLMYFYCVDYFSCFCWCGRFCFDFTSRIILNMKKNPSKHSNMRLPVLCIKWKKTCSCTNYFPLSMLMTFSKKERSSSYHKMTLKPFNFIAHVFEFLIFIFYSGLRSLKPQ